VDIQRVIDTRRRGEPDIALFVAVFALAGIGLAMSYSASAVYALRVFGDSFYFLKRQVLWFLIGFMALIFFQNYDYREYLKHTRFMLVLIFALLVMVLIPGVGSSAKGSARWLHFGFIGIQPSEFAKLVCVIYLVKIYSFDETDNHVLQLLIPMIVVALIFILIMLQPDFGTAMDLLIISVLIIFVSGFPFTYTDFESIYFDFGSKKIKPESIPDIYKIVEYMRENPEATLLIKGYADPPGSKRINKKISYQRALAVKNFIINMGIECDRITAKGVGEIKNSKKRKNSLYRRVDFIIKTR